MKPKQIAYISYVILLIIIGVCIVTHAYKTVDISYLHLDRCTHISHIAWLGDTVVLINSPEQLYKLNCSDYYYICSFRGISIFGVKNGVIFRYSVTFAPYTIIRCTKDKVYLTLLNPFVIILYILGIVLAYLGYKDVRG